MIFKRVEDATRETPVEPVKTETTTKAQSPVEINKDGFVKNPENPTVKLYQEL